MVHCSAWDYSLRVASSSADMDLMYKALTRQKFEVNQSFDKACGGLVDFPNLLNDSVVAQSIHVSDPQPQSWYSHVWHI